MPPFMRFLFAYAVAVSMVAHEAKGWASLIAGALFAVGFVGFMALLDVLQDGATARWKEWRASRLTPRR